MRYEVCDCGGVAEDEIDAGSPEEAAETFARQEDDGRRDEITVTVTDLATNESGEYIVTINRTATYLAERRTR